MKEIPGHNGYFASKEGHICSTRRGSLRQLKGYVNQDGYLTVTVTADDGIKRKTLVSRLIALTYHGTPPSSKSVARHLNGKQLDNRPDNLQWGTGFDNYMDAVKHGTRAHGEPVGGKITDCNTVKKIKGLLQSGLNGREIASMIGISTAQVSRIKNKKRWANVI